MKMKMILPKYIEYTLEQMTSVRKLFVSCLRTLQLHFPNLGKIRVNNLDSYWFHYLTQGSTS